MPSIDYSLCVGCEACAEAYPDVFLIRNGQAWVLDIDGIDPSFAENMVRTCIYGAISIDGPGMDGISNRAPTSRGRTGRRSR